MKDLNCAKSTMSQSSMPLRCQRDLFSIPEGHCYLNSAFMGPLPRLVEKAGVEALSARAAPVSMSARDFFDPAERVRRLCAQLVDADPERIAFVPTASYACAIVISSELAVVTERSVQCLWSTPLRWPVQCRSTPGDFKPML